MANKQALKQRIKSINSTKKITKAMEVIANVKLQKSKNVMEKNKEYASVLLNTISSILNERIDSDCIYLKKKTNDSKLFFIFVSDLGLCGAYNSNIVKLVKSLVNDNDYVYIIGTKQNSYFNKILNNILNDITNSDDLTFNDLKKMVTNALDMYAEDKISEISVIYTEFVNTVTFRSKVKTLLPLDVKEIALDNKSNQELLIEPSSDEILNSLIPMYLNSLVYSTYLETKTAEQGSRRFSMQNASDNADELNDKLVLLYNQARQASITQEITEIVSGADAL